MRVTNHELMSSLYHHYSICYQLKFSHYGLIIQQAHIQKGPQAKHIRHNS